MWRNPNSTFERNTVNTIKTIAIGALLASAAGLFHAANAHVTLEYGVANAGSTYKATFRVGHGCGASPTREIAVTIPVGVEGAKPMPKAGWTVAIERETLAQPRTDHGKTATDEVRRIRWTASSPQDALPGATGHLQLDGFGNVLRAPTWSVLRGGSAVPLGGR